MKASTFDEVQAALERACATKPRPLVRDVMTQKLAKSLSIGDSWQIGYEEAFDDALTFAVVVEWQKIDEKKGLYAWRELIS